MNVPTPEVDRGCLDPSNFIAVVQEHESETDLYSLGTRAGTEHTVLKKPIQPDEPKVPDNS